MAQHARVRDIIQYLALSFELKIRPRPSITRRFITSILAPTQHNLKRRKLHVQYVNSSRPLSKLKHKQGNAAFDGEHHEDKSHLWND